MAMKRGGRERIGLRRAQEIFRSYELLIPLVTDVKTLDAIATQCLDDMRLSENQRDALLAVLESKSNFLRVNLIHKGAT